MIGTTVSHYRILKKLGEGGMGVVYKAEDLRLKRPVALKFLSSGLTRDPEARARFIHEAQAASALDHTNICNIHEIDQGEDGQMFIAMALYEGQDLRNRIAQGPLPLAEAVSIALQLAEGLARAHGAGVVHRDLKPSNIIITTDGTAKIVDFGLAKLGQQTKLTRAGSTLGTVAYMSPEQVRGEKVDHRSDLWSLGVTIYEMLTGRLPFRGEQQQAVMRATLENEPEPITGLRTGVPLELERIVGKCLQKDPGERYQTAQDLAADLRHYQRTGDTATVPLQPASNGVASSAALKQLWRRRSFKYSMIATLLVIVAVAAGRILHRPSAQIDSIAVLPLENLTGDPDQQYFVDGMTDALITELYKIGALRVISKTSVMKYKQTDKSLPEIARELDVDAVVEGSVFRAGERVRITAQLIGTAPERHLWADVYERDVSDVLALQSEVAQTIAGEVHVTLTPEEQERLERVSPVNMTAYDLYLKGQAAMFERTGSSVPEAVDYFEAAIDIDSTYALAHAGLAEAYVLGVWGYLPIDRKEAVARAERSARRALQLDSTLAEAYVSLANVKMLSWDWSRVDAALRRALALNPSSVAAHEYYSQYLLFFERNDEAAEHIDLAATLDPRSARLKTMQGWPRNFRAQCNESISYFRRALEMDPSFALAHFNLGNVYQYKGDYEASILEYSKAVELDPSCKADVASQLPVLHAITGHEDANDGKLSHLLQGSTSGAIPSYWTAAVHAVRGDIDTAFQWLERAYEKRDLSLVLLRVTPYFKCLRSDPRFHELCLKIGLEPGSAFSRNSVYVAYEVHGDGEPAIVFIHGWCCNRSYWDAQVDYFSPRYKVVTLDLAGHGQSGYDMADWSIGALGEDVAAVVEKLDLKSLILVGNSLGGSVMLEAGLRMPERTLGLISVDGLADPETKFPVEEELAALRADFSGTVKRDIREKAFLEDADPALVQRVAENISNCDPRKAIPLATESLEYYNGGGCRRALEALHVPIRAIHSVNPIDADAFAPYASKMKWVNLKGIGHMPMMEDPERFNPILEGMIGEIIDETSSK